MIAVVLSSGVWINVTGWMDGYLGACCLIVGYSWCSGANSNCVECLSVLCLGFLWSVARLIISWVLFSFVLSFIIFLRTRNFLVHLSNNKIITIAVIISNNSQSGNSISSRLLVVELTRPILYEFDATFVESGVAFLVVLTAAFLHMFPPRLVPMLGTRSSHSLLPAVSGRGSCSVDVSMSGSVC